MYVNMSNSFKDCRIYDCHNTDRLLWFYKLKTTLHFSKTRFYCSKRLLIFCLILQTVFDSTDITEENITYNVARLKYENCF